MQIILKRSRLCAQPRLLRWTESLRRDELGIFYQKLNFTIAPTWTYSWTACRHVYCLMGMKGRVDYTSSSLGCVAMRVLISIILYRGLSTPLRRPRIWIVLEYGRRAHTSQTT